MLCNSSSFLVLVSFGPPFFCGCLVGLLSLGYFAPLLRPGVGVCRGLCLLAFHLLLPALVVPFCRVSFGLCAFLVVSLRCAAFFLCLFCFSCCRCFLFPVRLLCSFLLLVFGVVAVWPALSCCPLLPLPPWLVLWCLLVQSVLCWSLPPGVWMLIRCPSLLHRGIRPWVIQNPL